MKNNDKIQIVKHSNHYTLFAKVYWGDFDMNTIMKIGRIVWSDKNEEYQYIQRFGFLCDKNTLDQINEFMKSLEVEK